VGPDTADPDHLAGHFDEPVAVEQVATVSGEALAVTAEQVEDPLLELLGLLLGNELSHGNQQLPILIVIMRNRQYAILKSFAELEQTPGIPGLDLPGMDFVSIAQGYGCDAARIEDLDALKQAAANAWTKDVPTVLEVSVSGQVPPLV
jgi:hypothetical protein